MIQRQKGRLSDEEMKGREKQRREESSRLSFAVNGQSSSWEVPMEGDLIVTSGVIRRVRIGETRQKNQLNKIK